jgi:hypothetical protein
MRQTELDSFKNVVVAAWKRVADGVAQIRQQKHRVSEMKMRERDASLSEAF